MSGLRTLHITNAWHPTSGGIRTFYRALMDQAVREGRRMTLVVPAARTWYERVGQLGRIYYLAAPPSPLFDGRYRVLWPHRYLRPSVSAIWRILEREQPDLVEICDKYALVYLGGLIKGRARGRPRPTVVGLSCERMDDNVAAWLRWMPAGRTFAHAYMKRVYLPQFDAHIANSEYTAEELRMHAAPGKPIHVCPMGVERELFGPWRARRTARAGEAVLVYAGRLSPEKNVDLLPRIARELTMLGVAFRLIVAGEGPSRAALERASQAMAPGRVSFVDHLRSRDELADLLADADLFIHPNPREPFGIGPLEAMASGTPVVAPSAGGVLEYAGPANAWLCEAEPRAFAWTIDRALRAPALRQARTAAALRTADAFAWPAIASRMLALYEHIHAARGAQARSRDTAVTAA